MNAITRMLTYISGKFYKTVNQESILGSGNIEAGDGGGFTPTETQLEAIDSGINTEKVGQIETNKNNIETLNEKLTNKLDIKTTEGVKAYSHDGDTQGELIVKTAMSEEASDGAVLTEAALLKYAKKKYIHQMVRYNLDEYKIPMGWVSIINDKKEFGVADLKKFLKDNGYTSTVKCYHWVGGCSGTTGVRNSADSGTTYVGRVVSGIFYIESEDTLYFKYDYNGTTAVLENRVKFYTTPLQGEE